jgi:hypothetical protein
MYHRTFEAGRSGCQIINKHASIFFLLLRRLSILTAVSDVESIFAARVCEALIKGQTLSRLFMLVSNMRFQHQLSQLQ